MAEDRKPGVKAAVEALAAAELDAFALDRAEQLPLLAEDEAGRELVERARGRGRPPGAKNKRTQELAEAIHRRFGNPVVELAKLYAFVPVEVLAQRLKCDLVEAAKLQREALATVAKYTDQMMPQAVELDAGAVAAIFLGGGDPAFVRAATGIDPAELPELPQPVDAEFSEVEENQQVSDDQAGELDARELDVGEKGEADQ